MGLGLKSESTTQLLQGNKSEMKPRIIGPPPIISTIVKLITLATLCEALESKNGSNNTGYGNNTRVACDETCQMIWHGLQISLFLVELPCLLLFTFVFACYLCIRAEQRLHGWIVLAITGSLALRFGVNFLTNLPILYFDWYHEEYLQGICLTFGVLRHFFFFMCYCWALVLAFDLWRRVRTVTRRTVLDNETNRFLAYCAFGFGLPLLNVIIAVSLEWGVSDSAGLWKPSYHESCAVSVSSYDYYIGIPNGILLVANLTLLVLGFYCLWRAKQATGALDGAGGAIQKNLTGLLLKIFVLMGGLIIADFALQYTGTYEFSPYLSLPIEFVCRVGYALGFVWIFVFTGNAKEHLRRKYPRSFGKVFYTLEKGCVLKAEATNDLDMGDRYDGAFIPKC